MQASSGPRDRVASSSSSAPPQPRRLRTRAKVVVLPEILVVLEDTRNESRHPSCDSRDSTFGDVLVEGSAHHPPAHGPAPLAPFVAF